MVKLRWMRWGSAIIEHLPASIEIGESMKNGVSSPEIWTMGEGTSVIDMMSSSNAARTDLPFADAPFEFEDISRTSASSSSIQNDNLLCLTTASYPTQGQVQQELRSSYCGISSLTEAEERSLQDIGVPYYALSNIKVTSVATLPVATLPVATLPTESQSSPSPSPSPEPEIRKRKYVDLEEQPSNAICQSKKRAHNAIEKRYRTNLNAKIESLRKGVPSLCGENINAGEADTNSGQQKHGKAAILIRALEYIQHLEKTTRRLGSEVDTLKTRVGAFEKLALSGGIVLNSNGMEAMNRPASTKSETLETIQLDFQQMQFKAVATPANKKRGLREKKAS